MYPYNSFRIIKPNWNHSQSNIALTICRDDIHMHPAVCMVHVEIG